MRLVHTPARHGKLAATIELPIGPDNEYQDADVSVWYDYTPPWRAMRGSPATAPDVDITGVFYRNGQADVDLYALADSEGLLQHLEAQIYAKEAQHDSAD